MFPILFSLGQFDLRTINLFVIMAFLAGGFVFWRKGKEEHYSEIQLFDGFLLSLTFGFILGRVFFVIFNFSKFGWSIVQWLDVFSNPGINNFILFVAAGVYLYKFAQNKKWDVFEILDFGVMAMAISQIFLWLGAFLDGSYFGVKTNLPVGMVFPGVFERHHPLQLYYVVFYFILFIYLSRVEYRYRTFNWYRHGKKTAQTGFLTSMLFVSFGLFGALASFVSISSLRFYGVRLDFFGHILIFLFGLLILGLRSGRISTKLLGKRNKGLLEKFKV